MCEHSDILTLTLCVVRATVNIARQVRGYVAMGSNKKCQEFDIRGGLIWKSNVHFCAERCMKIS